MISDTLVGSLAPAPSPDDTVGDLKKLVAAQTGTRADKIVLKKWYTIFKDHITLQDCILNPLLLFSCQIVCLNFPDSYLSDEIHDGMNLELYYQ